MSNVASIDDARGPARKLVLSVGATRTTKKAQQKKITWAMFVDKCREPVRTKEKHAEYLKLPKSEQDSIKDVGWYVGGRLRDGVRKKDHLESRDFVTLDIDFAGDDWDFDLDDCYGRYTWAVYSTHKHSAENPRLRLVFPLSRPVTPDEYPAIARAVADWWDVEVYDDTTYQASRVMYWPSCSSDSEYVFRENVGRLLDPDAVLAGYDDWTDVASWPVSIRQGRAIENSVKKAADPWAKPGVIGDFCRAYPIPDAIDAFLSHVYIRSDSAPDDRFTFTGGSTSNGAIVYNDGRFLYSNHGTDPVGGRSVNAWDLVRVHLYGEQDDADAEDGSPTKRPSHKAMIDLANRDDRVAEARIENLFDDWDEPETTGSGAGVAPPPVAAKLGEAVEFTDEDREALKGLDRTQEGDVCNHITNVLTILRHDKRLKGSVAWNDFAQDLVQVRGLPGSPVHDAVNGDLWSDKQDSFLVAYIHKRYGIEPPKGRLIDALNNLGSENRFHPVRAYLERLVWDRVPRVDTLLVDCFKAEDNPYTRAVTRKMMAAAVARAFEPGVKFDHMLILEGAQGVGKSAFWRDLAQSWFTDDLGSMGKDSVENMKGKWLCEVGELTQFKKAEVEHIKAFISRQVDRIREAYARRSVDFPRQNVFVGSTNDFEGYLKDDENRRFWPVRCHITKAVDPLSREAIGQLWAEAVELYKAGEPLYLEDAAVAQLAVEEQRARQSDRDVVGDLAAWLDLPSDDFEDEDGLPSLRDCVTAQELWTGFYNERGRPDNGSQAQIRRIMRLVPGWSDVTYPRKIDGVSRRVYTRESRI